MKIAFLVHAASSCWNNGNAHFLRGIASALQALGHEVTLLEPLDGWSRTNMLRDGGLPALQAFHRRFPELAVRGYGSGRDAVAAIEQLDPDLVVVHEWNEPGLVNALGTRRKLGARFVLLFHDTHHRALTQPEELSRFDLSGYDGVLAFGACIAEIYERRGWGRRAWTWHEAADVRRFRPKPQETVGDLVWIGNWGDDERSAELREFLIEPAGALDLKTTVHGVRYPQEAVAELRAHGIDYKGWLPNHDAPQAFARHRATIHVPRRPYAETLRGIPTIRVFEALACGIPLVSAPWADDEGLFRDEVYLTATNGEDMVKRLRTVLEDVDHARELRARGIACILERHTCDHRARELLEIHASVAALQDVDRPEVRA